MHHEVLTKDGRALFPLLKDFEDFYLAGGTALALQIGHRISVDFDLFFSQEIAKNLLPKVKRVFAGRDIHVVIDNKDELTVFVAGVKVTFLYYPYPPKKPLVNEGGLMILSQEELASTKAYTIGRRGSLKDYIDLYFILAENVTTLEEIIKLAEEKFGGDFNARLFLEQLIYLDDIEETEIVFLKKVVSKKELRDFFLLAIKDFKF